MYTRQIFIPTIELITLVSKTLLSTKKILKLEIVNANRNILKSKKYIDKLMFKRECELLNIKK